MLPLYGKNLKESENYYAVTTNEHGHIFKLELELLENNKLSISHFVCFRCLRFSNKINLDVGFVKTICKDNINQPNIFSTYCRSTKISTGLYEKQIKGNLNKAVMGGGNALHETEFPYGKAIFTFLDKKEFFEYKNFIENNLFITTTDFKSELKLKNIEKEKVILEKELKKIKEKIKKMLA